MFHGTLCSRRQAPAPQPQLYTHLHPQRRDPAYGHQNVGVGTPYIDLRQLYATDRMLIDSENAGEGKVTKMTRRTSLCYSGLINIEPSIDAVSNKHPI
jgi:hypothetical protein